MARAGVFVQQPKGYIAFLPNPLPPDPQLEIEGQLLELLSQADQELGRLDGATEVLPNPDLFVAMYVRQEALLSSQIEGTQASLVDVLEFEADAKPTNPYDVGEVVNYIRAMDYGLERLKELPLSLRLLREIHHELLHTGRGAERQPGEFRTSQNYISGTRLGLSNASFVPPPPYEMLQAINALEDFIRAPTPMPLLVKCALIHAQFETIHPFLDGNGRMGRLLITFLLVWKSALKRPLLYLSVYFKQHREDYYNKLQRVREVGDWEGWLAFFLTGVIETASSATQTARKILQIRETFRDQVVRECHSPANTLRLLELLFQQPVVTANHISTALQVSLPTANSLIKQLENLHILVQTTTGKRNRRFMFGPYISLFKPSLSEPGQPAEDRTQTEPDNATR